MKQILIVFISAILLASQAAAEDMPDIVVYLADDLSTADLAVYGGSDIATPAISQLAKDGLTFNRAFVASPSCAPSRAAFLTGLMPARNGAEENHSYPRDNVLRLPQVLNKLGYQTAAFGKVAHLKSAPSYRFEIHDRKSNIPDVRQSVKTFLESRTDTRPLALFVGVSDPHVPWPAESTVDPATLKMPPLLLDTPRTRFQRARYLQEVKNLDAYLAELRTLTKKHLSKDQLFVFSSDHGAQFPFGKWTLYDEGINVPLIVAQSGKIQSATRTDAMVSWIDIMPTLIDVAGGEVPPNLDGRSFAKVLRSETASHRKRIFTTHSGDKTMNVYLSRSIRTDRFKLIWNPHPEFAFTTHIDVLLRKSSGDYFKQWTDQATTNPRAATLVGRHHKRPEYELFDVNTDPKELNNLAGKPELADVQKRLTTELNEWITEQGDELTIFHEPKLLAAPMTWKPRPKVWIYTDMSDSTIPGPNHRGTINDPDDISAMAGYLLMANMFDTRGIVVTSTNRPDHKSTPNQADWANKFFGVPYRAEVAARNKAFGGGYPANIKFTQSCIKETAERFNPATNYRSLKKYSTVRALRDEAAGLRRGELMNVLCWGSLTESAVLVKHCVDSKRSNLLKKLRFIAHWTSSSLHMGSEEHPETVPNCSEDAAACAYLKKMALAGKITYHECGAIGQHGIVGGAPKGAEYYDQFKASRLGRIFAEGKFVRGHVDHSDSATYWTLLGTWGVSLNDIAATGTNPTATERANEAKFRDASKRIHDELLRRSQLN
ncbi:MAG: sulfatase-like hydrolase/transferase [Planctomycetaceae bacterium]